ncbi:MAG: hypothetical protein AAF211_23365 [Myxococcota bacterium]
MRFTMLALLIGCGDGAFGLGPPEPRDCETRQAFYPDADGDGLGEPTTVVFGCEAPEGFVTELGPTGDTGAPDDTGMP